MTPCPYLTGLWTFRCLAREELVIPRITEETRYCLSGHPERCPHYMEAEGGLHRNHLVTRSQSVVKMY